MRLLIGLARRALWLANASVTPRTPTHKEVRYRAAFRRAYRWRAGIEGRISVLKRRFGLDPCRYRGEAGMERWVGWACWPTTCAKSVGQWLPNRPVDQCVNNSYLGKSNPCSNHAETGFLPGFCT
jgi:hypothetical protein